MNMIEKTVPVDALHPEIASSLLNHIPDAVMLLSVEGEMFYRFAFINNAAIDWFNWPANVCGMLLHQVWPEDSQGIILKHCREAAASRSSITFNELVCLPQNKTARQMVLTPLFNERNLCTHLIFTIQGISKSSIQKTQIEMDHSFFEAFFTHSVDPISLWTVKGDLLELNPAFKKVFGWEEGAFKTETALHTCGFIPEDKGEEAEILFQQMLQGHTISHYETQRRHKDGRLLDVAITYLPIKNQKGNVTAGAISFCDISETKKLERELRNVKEQLELVWNNTADAIDLFTLQGRLLQINPAFTSLFGWTKEDTEGERPAIIFTPPHLKEELQQMRSQLRRGQTIVSLETERQKKDGSTLDVLATYNPLKNKAGEVWAVIGVYKDITKLKQVQAELRESEERYRIIAEHSHDIIKVLHSNGQITYASPSHEKVIGFKPDELVGKTFFNTIHKEDVEQIRKQFESSIAENSMCQAQFRQYTKDGSWIWVEAIFTPVSSKEGLVQQYTVAARDITQRKRDEEELQNYASLDSLTGVYNRRMFTEFIDKEIAAAKHSCRSFAVMYMDIDKFKEVNDSYGHEIGDELLKQFVQRLMKATRKSDMIARMGGDEFTILLSGINSLKEVTEVAERIQQELRMPYHLQGHMIRATSSNGIAFYPHHGESTQVLLRHADRALYKAKENRNTYHIYG